MVQLLFRQRKQFAEIIDDPIGIAQALPAAIAVGHTTSSGTGILAHLNVVCCIAHNDEEYTADGETYMAGSIFVANARDIRPFEAYVYTTNAGRAPYLRIGKETTSIVLSTGNGQLTTEIYDLTGRKVQNTETLKGGIYIINGKKVVIK